MVIKGYHVLMTTNEESAVLEVKVFPKDGFTGEQAKAEADGLLVGTDFKTKLERNIVCIRIAHKKLRVREALRDRVRVALANMEKGELDGETGGKFRRF